MKKILFIVAITAQIFNGSASGADASVCSKRTQGNTSCMDNKLCECVYQEGGGISKNTFTGYRWDCGAERPVCGAPQPETPAMPDISNNPQNENK